MRKLFISYSRKDLDFARNLAGDLEKAGFEVWWDISDLKGGDDWVRAIPPAIETSQAFVILLSPDSVVSEWVKKEYLHALKLSKKILPVMIKPCQVPFALANISYLDFTQGNPVANFTRLLAGLQYQGELAQEFDELAKSKAQVRKTGRAVGKKAATPNLNTVSQTLRGPAPEVKPPASEVPQPTGSSFGLEEEPPANANQPAATDAPAKKPAYRARVSAAPSLRFRSGPGARFPATGQISQNEIITILDEQEDEQKQVWGKIGPDQWVMLQYTFRLREPERPKYRYEYQHGKVLLTVAYTFKGWRIEGVDGLFIDEPQALNAPSGSFFKAVLDDLPAEAERTRLQAYLQEQEKTFPATENPFMIPLPPELGPILLPYPPAGKATIIVGTSNRQSWEDETQRDTYIQGILRNSITFAGANGVTHLLMPVIGGPAEKHIESTLQTLLGMGDFGSLKNITIVTIRGALAAAARDRFRLLKATQANLLENNCAEPPCNDRAQGKDQFGIQAEVEALADTLLLREVEPPIAVGVLGGWGSGKSFVMHLIKECIKEIRAKPVKGGWPYVGHIYLIEFNAWTYAKSNLWASLMNTIFYSLSKQMQIEHLLAHKDFNPDQPTPPSNDELVSKMRAGGPVFQKIYTENLQIDRDENLKEWQDNLVKWSGHLLKENLLWNIMRGTQVAKLEKLRDTEEQLKQRKQQRARFEKNHPPQQISSTKLTDAARKAYIESLRSYLLTFVTNEPSQDIKKRLAKYVVDENGFQKYLEDAARNKLEITKEELKKYLPDADEKGLQKYLEDAARDKREITKEDLQKYWVEAEEKKLRKYLEDAKGLVGGFNTLLAAFSRSRIYSIWTLVFLIITAAVPYVWKTYEPLISEWIPWTVSLFMALLPLLRVLIPWLQEASKFGLEAKQALESAYATQQAKQAEDIASATDKPLEQKIEELQKMITDDGSLIAYDKLTTLLETQAEEQRRQAGPSAKYANLTEFVQSRLDAATYENQLGLMHQVRQDFDELTTSLQTITDQKLFPRGKPRVILFIDDLDRCPPLRVVEVLEAVQLLLSTELFIVVLGLDTRYVTRALEKEYKEILQHEGDPSGLDYIEKIIQIPYRVQSIANEGLKNYLEGQMKVKLPETGDQAKEEKTTPPSNDAPTIVTEAAQVTATSEAVSEQPEPAPEETPPPELVEEQSTEIELPAAVIKFKPEDIADLNACCQKISLTPRSIKRLVNVLKLMKIFWFRTAKPTIEDRDQSRLIKQAAIILLALSSAYPEVMREVFVNVEDLYQQGKQKTELFTALESVKPPHNSIREITWQIEKYKTNLKILKTLPGINQDHHYGQITLDVLTPPIFNLIRSFSFVGDPVYWKDEEAAAHKPEQSVWSKLAAKTISEPKLLNVDPKLITDESTVYE